MASQHVKGAASAAQGNVKEAAGKLTGNTELEAKGKALKLQAKAQGVLGDVEDAVSRAKSR